MIYCRYFGDFWLLVYHPRYWRTCLTSRPVVLRWDADGWFVKLWMVQIGTGDMK